MVLRPRVWRGRQVAEKGSKTLPEHPEFGRGLVHGLSVPALERVGCPQCYRTHTGHLHAQGRNARPMFVGCPFSGCPGEVVSCRRTSRGSPHGFGNASALLPSVARVKSTGLQFRNSRSRVSPRLLVADRRPSKSGGDRRQNGTSRETNIHDSRCARSVREAAFERSECSRADTTGTQRGETPNQSVVIFWVG